MKKICGLLVFLACAVLYAADDTVALRDFQADPRKYLGKSVTIENVEMHTVYNGTSPKDGHGSCYASVYDEDLSITIYFRRKNLERLCRQWNKKMVDVTVKVVNYKGPNGKRAYLFELQKIKENSGGDEAAPQQPQDETEGNDEENKPAKKTPKKKAT